MKTIFISLLFFLFSVGLYGQLKKHPIASTGCSAYFFCDPGTFDKSYSEDSSLIYTTECAAKEINYGCICIQLKEPITDLQSAEDVMISYLDYLKTSFNVKSAAGYGKGHHLKENESTRGVLDYWDDDKSNHWKVKGWTNGKFIAVLYAYSAKELSESPVNVFLEGFRLPGM